MDYKEIENLLKDKIKRRRNSKTEAELEEENFEMMTRIRKEVFHLYDKLSNWNKTDRCWVLGTKDGMEISIKDDMEESVYDFETELSEYEMVILKDLITTFYGISKGWYEGLLQCEFLNVAVKPMMVYFWDAIHTIKFTEETIFNFNNGRERIKDFGKHKKNSRDGFLNNILIPLQSGEVAHHLTNTIIIGIPEEVHRRLSGYDREIHRKKVSEWLDKQAEKAKIARTYLALNEENE